MSDERPRLSVVDSGTHPHRPRTDAEMEAAARAAMDRLAADPPERKVSDFRGAWRMGYGHVTDPGTLAALLAQRAGSAAGQLADMQLVSDDELRARARRHAIDECLLTAAAFMEAARNLTTPEDWLRGA